MEDKFFGNHIRIDTANPEQIKRTMPPCLQQEFVKQKEIQGDSDVNIHAFTLAHIPTSEKEYANSKLLKFGRKAKLAIIQGGRNE